MRRIGLFAGIKPGRGCSEVAPDNVREAAAKRDGMTMLDFTRVEA